MGCFNVVCSISNLSLNQGTKVGFIPLLPNAYGKVHQVAPSSSLIYPNCYFNPFSLPIFGEYNDYGSLENIEENDNTKTIEAFFGISIEQFVAILTCGRDITDYYGELFKAYAMHQNLMSNHAVKVDDAFLTALGFVHVGKKRYTYEEYPLYVEASDDNYQMYDTSGRLIGQRNGYGAKSQLMKDFEKKTGYLLLVPKEKQEKVKLIRTLSGMFVHRSIYEELADYNRKEQTLATEYVSKEALVALGFNIKEENDQQILYEKDEQSPYVSKEGNGVSIQSRFGKNNKMLRGYIYSLRSFAEAWEEITEEALDIQSYERVCTHDVDFDAFSTWMREEFSKEDESLLQKIERRLQDDSLTAENKQELIALFIDLKETKSQSSQFDRHEYGRFFEGWKYFENLYIPLIQEGKLKKAFTDYKAFYFSMYSCNRFFFPGMNGEQHGNLEASKVLLETSLALVNEALAEREYWEKDDEREEWENNFQ